MDQAQKNINLQFLCAILRESEWRKLTVDQEKEEDELKA